MKLPKDEASVLAYFPSSNAAAQAAEKLKQEGYEAVQVDRVSRYPGDGTEVRRSPVTGEITSLADLTLGTEYKMEAGDDLAILLSTDPSASGLAHAGLAGGRAYLVTVVAPKESIDRAREILNQSGGDAELASWGSPRG